MNISELSELLSREGFRPSSYSLGDEIKDEALCLRHDERGWSVFYSERGLQTGKKVFGDESSACIFFIEKIRADPTTRLDWKSGFSM